MRRDSKLGGVQRSLEILMAVLVVFAPMIAHATESAESLRTRTSDVLESAPTFMADGLSAFSWVGRYQVISQSRDAVISGIPGYIEVGTGDGVDPLFVRVWHNEASVPWESRVAAGFLNPDGWATVVVRWDQSRQGHNQEVRVNGKIVTTGNIAAALVKRVLGGAVTLGSIGADVRQYDIGLYDRWLTDEEVARYESFHLNVKEIKAGRLWAVLGGFDRQSGKVMPHDLGIADLEGNTVLRPSGSPQWDNKFPKDEFIFDVARIEQPFMYDSGMAGLPAKDISLLNWNIEYWPGGVERRQRSTGEGFSPKPQNVARQFEAVTGVLESERPEIMCLQEIYNLASLEFLLDGLTTSYPFVTCTAFGFDNEDPELNQYQNLHVNPGDWEGVQRPPYRNEGAILSQYPIDEAWEIEIYEQVQVVPGTLRSALGILGAIITPPGQDPLIVYVVHPRHSPEMWDIRDSTFRVIFRDIEQRGFDPEVDDIVICGDFNANAFKYPPEQLFADLIQNGFLETWEGVNQSRRATFYASAGEPRTIDYVYVSKAIGQLRAHIVPDSGSIDKSLYRAGKTPGIASDHFAISTVLRPAEQTMAVIGDYGSGNSKERAVADLVDGWNVDCVITTGDNNYGDIATGWDGRVGSYYGHFLLKDDSVGFPRYALQTSSVQRFFPTIGNHDTPAGAGTSRYYLDYFHDLASGGPGRLPVGTGRHTEAETYYDFVWGDVHFWMVDSEHALSNPTSMADQKQWLQYGLADSESTWNVVVSHHAPYSSGWHGEYTKMQWPFNEWGADAVISGHDHEYERIHPFGRTPYFVNGSGGAILREFYEILPGSAVRFYRAHGAMKMTAGPSRLLFEFYSIENGETLIDSFELSNCYADCDTTTGLGSLDIFDFLCFQNSFVNAEPYACDCDSSTGASVCDVFDFLCFQNAFVGGCQ